jgi:hypothetical protein
MAKPCSYNQINPAAMFRALGDVAERFPCIAFNFQGTTDFDVLHAFDVPDQLVNHGIDCTATFRFLLDQPTIRLALGAAYKQHSGNDAPFLSNPEREAVDSGRCT